MAYTCWEIKYTDRFGRLITMLEVLGAAMTEDRLTRHYDLRLPRDAVLVSVKQITDEEYRRRRKFTVSRHRNH